MPLHIPCTQQYEGEPDTYDKLPEMLTRDAAWELARRAYALGARNQSSMTSETREHEARILESFYGHAKTALPKKRQRVRSARVGTGSGLTATAASGAVALHVGNNTAYLDAADLDTLKDLIRRPTEWTTEET